MCTKMGTKMDTKIDTMATKIDTKMDTNMYTNLYKSFQPRLTVGETPVVAMRRFLLLLALAREFYRYGVG